MSTTADILLAEDALVVPSIPGRLPLTLDLRAIKKAEQRLHEVQLASRVRSGELMHLFNHASLECGKLTAKLASEEGFALRYAKTVRAQALFERLPPILKEKGLASTRSPLGAEDIRSAAVEADPEYNKALETLTDVQVAIKFLAVRKEAFDKAYWTVHKLTDSRPAPGQSTFDSDSSV